jgi:ABC-type spermidine/putrescine transport system permease subunit II
MSVATQQPSVVPAGSAEKDKPNIMFALLEAPAVIVLFLWMIVPLLMTIYFSFIRFSLVNPDVKGFAGLENYQFLIEDEAFWPAIINTVVLMGTVLIITVVLGTLLFSHGFESGRNSGTSLLGHRGRVGVRPSQNVRENSAK